MLQLYNSPDQKLTGINPGKGAEDITFRLQNICGIIDGASENSEDEFLDIGHNLQQYMAASREITSLSAKAALSYSDNVFKSGISELTLLVKQFSSYLSDFALIIKNEKTELNAIYKNIETIIDGMSDFKRVSKKLRMLGISIKIESARLGNDGKGFYYLSGSIEKLSGIVIEKAGGISKKATALLCCISDTITCLNQLGVKQTNQADLILKKTASTIEDLEFYRDEFVRKAERVSANSENMSKNIYDIITSVQFHDITSQQMMHIKEALNGLAEKINQEHRDPDDNCRNEELVYDVCELQSYQLKNSINEFENAVINIIRKLRGVENNISNILDDLSGENETTNNQWLETARKEIAAIPRDMEKILEIDSEISLSIRSVINIVKELDTFAPYISDIEEIGMEIELLALNAGVKAAHTGKDAAALSVLAEAIQGFSLEVKLQTADSAKILHNIDTSSKSLKLYLKINGEDRILARTNEKTGGLIREIMECEKSSVLLIGELGKEIELFKKEINKKIGEIDIHIRLKEILGSAFEELKVITDRFVNDIDLDSSRFLNIKSLDKNYTMSRERDIHQLIAGINRTSEYDQSCNVSVLEDNFFDENIELF